MQLPTPITSFLLDGRVFFIKRDDLYDPYLSGNKFRKLFHLLNTPKDQISQVVSYGGTQSNAMVAIAALCAEKNWHFCYYTKPFSKKQRELQSGNFAKALDFGMWHVELEDYRAHIDAMRLNFDPKVAIIDQGGADPHAKIGLETLAQELQSQLPHAKSFATPSGTGTTALFLAHAMPEATIYTTPCVGDRHYLELQMQALAPLPKNLIILESKQKYRFAKPYKEHYEIYKKLLACGVEFDLLYAPLMWQLLLEQTDEQICYIHSGGVSGNESMLERYARMELIKK